MAVVISRAWHNLHVVGWRIGTIDARSFQVINVGSVPTIEIGGADIILALVLEHTVALTAGTFINLMTVFETNFPIGTYPNLRKINARASLSVAVAEIRLAGVGIGEDSHVARIRRTNHVGHINLVVALEIASGRIARSNQYVVVELRQKRVLLRLGYVDYPQASHPISPTGRRGSEHIIDKGPIDQVVASIASDRQEVGHIALAASQGFGTVVDSLLVFCTIPIIVLHTLRIGESENTTALTVNVIAGGGLPKRVIDNQWHIAIICLSTHQR